MSSRTIAATRVEPAIASPEDQRVTFVELFFDLVFVFCITQVVGLLHDGITWTAVGQAVLAFWLIWWAWTQFTWALNAADTTNHRVQLATLIATAVAFFLAVAVPQAFREGALWFAVPYVLVRAVGLGVYGWVAESNPSQHAAVRKFTLVSTGGLVAVLAGAFLGGSLQYAVWGLAILLDIIAAGIGAQQEGWDLHPEHFGERHGLIIIIALGETLIVAAAGLGSAVWSLQLVAVAVLAVALSCALWWTYFTRIKPQLDHALESCTGSVQSSMARDVFSLVHFPMLCGVIAYAAAIENAVAHPTDPFSGSVRLVLAIGLALFVEGLALATWRASGRVLLPRIVLGALTALAVVGAGGVPPAVSLALGLVGVTAVAFWEHRSEQPA
ncbi:MAG: low temperature requirement protein A [Gemmatimonadota bacterium]